MNLFSAMFNRGLKCNLVSRAENILFTDFMLWQVVGKVELRVPRFQNVLFLTS